MKTISKKEFQSIYDSMTLEQASKALGVSIQTLRRYAKLQGLKKLPHGAKLNIVEEK